MRLWTLCLIAGFLPAGNAIPVTRAEGQRLDELKWAKGVALDFFAVAGRHRSDAAGLLTPELAKWVQESNRWSFFSELENGRYNDPKMTSEELAPNGNEVILKGILKGENRLADFTLRIARESANRPWKIRFVRIAPREDEADK